MSFLLQQSQAVASGDRGKRVIGERSHYQSNDYLKDQRPEAETTGSESHAPIGKSSGRASKFKVGFYRRPIASIAPHAERESYEESKESAAQQLAVRRAEHLQKMSVRNGNIIVPTNGGSASAASDSTSNTTSASASSSPPFSSASSIASTPPSIIPEAKIFPSRRHFPSRNHEISLQNHSRQKIGSQRFHIELNEKEEEWRKGQIEKRLEQQKQTSSVIGYGRSDLSTDGVIDNFRNSTYTQDELLSRPKVKPPPDDVIGVRQNKTSLVLSDGSTLYGSKARQQQQQAQQQKQEHQNESSHIHGGAGSLPAPSQGRRANRSNQTSSALSDALRYEPVERSNRAKADPVQMSPAGSAAQVPPPIFRPTNPLW